MLFKSHVRKYRNNSYGDQPEQEGWVGKAVTAGAVVARKKEAGEQKEM